MIRVLEVGVAGVLCILRPLKKNLLGLWVIYYLKNYATKKLKSTAILSLKQCGMHCYVVLSNIYVFYSEVG